MVDGAEVTVGTTVGVAEVKAPAGKRPAAGFGFGAGLFVGAKANEADHAGRIKP